SQVPSRHAGPPEPPPEASEVSAGSGLSVLGPGSVAGSLASAVGLGAAELGDAGGSGSEPEHAARARTARAVGTSSRERMSPSSQDRTLQDHRDERVKRHGPHPPPSLTVFRVNIAARAAAHPELASRVRVASRFGFVLGLATTVLSLAGVWLVWKVFVTTAEGQRVDQAAMDGAQFGRTRLWQIAEPVLEIVSVPALAIVVVAAMSIAVLRRRWMLALQIAALVIGANLTTQGLKYLVLDRP